MGIIEDLRLDDPAHVDDAIKDYSRNQTQIREDLRIFLQDKHGMQNISDIHITNLLKREEVVRILLGSIISDAVIEGHGATSREAMEIMGWIPGGELPFDDMSEDWEGHNKYFSKVA